LSSEGGTKREREREREREGRTSKEEERRAFESNCFMNIKATAKPNERERTVADRIVAQSLSFAV
jgi:hypothetical protein